mmetsp:Transcript_1326/g.1128  ORF Transcript_1326/g.1128 Transcript_1326/m.1128 type:complete len:99 (-) Transcript_1326:92-388(-)
MGVMSTPNAGGIAFRIERSSDSVGQVTSSQGISFKFVFGYQLRTTRQSIAKEKRFKNGPKTDAKGCTMVPPQLALTKRRHPQNGPVEEGPSFAMGTPG